MAMAISALWIIFDVLICLRTGYMTEPFPRWEWWTWLVAGLALALFAVLADWRRLRNERRERAQERAEDLSETKSFVQQAQEAIQKDVQSLKTDITAIVLKPEAAETKIEEINQRIENWNPPISIGYDQMMMRARRRNPFGMFPWLKAQRRG